MCPKRVFLTTLALWLAIVSCNLPGRQSAQPTPQETSTGLSAEKLAGTITALVSYTQVVEATSTPSLAPVTETVTVTPTLCMPSAVSNSNANVRSGPGIVYNIVGFAKTGAALTVTGKNAEGTWWYIMYPAALEGYAWISGSVVTTSCIPASLAVIAAPPTPKSPTVPTSVIPTSVIPTSVIPTSVIPTSVIPTSVIPTSVIPTSIGPTPVP